MRIVSLIASSVILLNNYNLIVTVNGFTHVKTSTTSPLFQKRHTISSLPNSRHSQPLRPNYICHNPSHKVTSSQRHRLSASAIPIQSLSFWFENYPYLAAFLTCGFKASAADAVAQVKDRSKAKKKNGGTTTIVRFQFLRNLAFILYGGLYQGATQEYLYNHIFPQLFGSGTGPATVAAKVAFDMLVLTPFLCLPIAYVVKGIILGSSGGGGIIGGLQRYKSDVLNRGLLFKYWSLWAPVQCITFGVIPEQFRISFIAVVSFFWLIILSSISSKGAVKKPKVDDDVVMEMKECRLTDAMTCES